MRKLFEEFVKHHKPNFKLTAVGSSYCLCIGINCGECKVTTVCSVGGADIDDDDHSPYLSLDEYDTMKSLYPEYFI